MTMILGIDVETTGLDPEKDEVIELGFALWDWEKRKPVVCGSYLIQPRAPLSEEIKKITGISDDDFNYQNSQQVAWRELSKFIDKSDYLMAHNAAFDRSFVSKCVPVYIDTIGFAEKIWIDTLIDIDYDQSKAKHKNLTYLSATHGFVNPFPHRALFDVLSMLKVASNYDLNAMVDSARSPLITLVALVSFDKKDAAKALGFNWNPNDKRWEMKIKKFQADKLLKDSAFKNAEFKVIEV